MNVLIEPAPIVLSLAIVAAICVRPSATDSRSDPPAWRAEGTTRAIAARTAGTRLDPPVRKTVSIASDVRPAARMQSRADPDSRSIRPATSAS